MKRTDISTLDVVAFTIGALAIAPAGAFLIYYGGKTALIVFAVVIFAAVYICRQLCKVDPPLVFTAPQVAEFLWPHEETTVAYRDEDDVWVVTSPFWTYHRHVRLRQRGWEYHDSGPRARKGWWMVLGLNKLSYR